MSNSTQRKVPGLVGQRQDRAYNRHVTADRAPAAPFHALVLATLNEQGKSQNWLHKRTGISRNTISAWAKQPRPPQAGTVLAVADALGIDRGEALRLAGVMADTKAALEGTTVDLSEVDTEVLLAEIRRRIRG
ncbi:helix-turn-helix transcriptional regulator [Sphaerisporangium sp. TRM90804]|uniref:helix-turn-helix domain-containing protein n=1 Tax=Sphaerisporangium sp. TRM90804 TaxID=3031113 RepID=UPI00244CE382|nr:helix-turn-helix transcriptional regulator [Sphaerisporangium sp. TRM90804]MDH2424838.1 helix-turn-helix transcriptional regulator [Sphaerisporangium sp. TRM90804]